MQKPKIIHRLIVTEVAIDYQNSKFYILVKNLQGQIIELFDSIIDYSAWCEKNFVKEADFTEDDE